MRFLTKARPIGAAAVALIAIAAAAAFWLWRSSPIARRLDPHWNAVVTSIAGDGAIGVRDGDAGRANFSDLFGVAARDGAVFVSDAGLAQRIRRISADGLVSTVAGSAEGVQGFVDGPGPAARFNTPSGLAFGPDGALYLADTGNNAVRRITPDGQVTTVAGNGVAGYRDGVAHDAEFNGPVGVAIDRTGRVIVADTYNDRVRAIARDGSVTTIAVAPEAEPFSTPCGVAVDADGTIYVADTGNGQIRAIAPSGAVTTIASSNDGLLRPTGVAVGPSREIYATDDRGRIVEAFPDGSFRIVAGSRPGFGDGAAADAKFRRLTGLALEVPGRLIVADAGNALVRLVAAPSQMDTRPPPAPHIDPEFDVRGFAWQPLLWPLDPMEGPHEIAGTMGEARGGEGGERFHAGIDVHADEGTPVRAVRDGVVSQPISTYEFGTLNESVRIGAVTYVHLRVGRERRGPLVDSSRFVGSYDAEGTLIGMRVKRGARFTTGEEIGSVNAFNHVHMNVGWTGEEYNPLLFRLVQFEDTVAPTIPRGGVRLLDPAGQPIKERAKGRVVVRGPVQIVVDAWDQVDGNAKRRRLGLYSLGYQVLNGNGLPVPGFESPRETIVFDRLSTAPDAARTVYAPGSGIPFYGRRVTRFLYVVTNTFREGQPSAGVWDPSPLAPGNYIIRIRARDVRGNEATANRDLAITVVR